VCVCNGGGKIRAFSRAVTDDDFWRGKTTNFHPERRATTTALILMND